MENKKKGKSGILDKTCSRILCKQLAYLFIHLTTLLQSSFVLSLRYEWNSKWVEIVWIDTFLLYFVCIKVTVQKQTNCFLNGKWDAVLIE